MQAQLNRVHHVVALVRPENFIGTMGKLSNALQTSFYGPFERREFGVRIAVSMDSGIELITPLSSAADDPLIRSLDEHGERWVTVVVGVRDLEDACRRLERLGHEIEYHHELLNSVPISDRYARLDEVRISPAAFGGLPILLAKVVERQEDGETGQG